MLEQEACICEQAEVHVWPVLPCTHTTAAFGVDVGYMNAEVGDREGMGIKVGRETGVDVIGTGVGFLAAVVG